MSWESTVYTHDNLTTHNVLPVLNCSYSLVHKDHPIIALLRANPEVLNESIESEPLIQDEWYRVSHGVIKICGDRLRETLVPRSVIVQPPPGPPTGPN